MNRFEQYEPQWSDSVPFDVTPGQVDAFARVMGLEFAETPKTLSAIPTFLTLFRAREFTILGNMGIELKDVLHVDQEYAWLKPIEVGAKVSYRTRLKEITPKRGKGMLLYFLVFETEVSVGEEPRATCRSTILYRELVTETPVKETETSNA